MDSADRIASRFVRKSASHVVVDDSGAFSSAFITGRLVASAVGLVVIVVGAQLQPRATAGEIASHPYL